MTRSIVVGILSLCAVPAIARADDAPPAPAPAASADATATTETPRPPPFVRGCSDPEHEGELRISTGCSGVVGLRGATTTVRGAPSGAGPGLMFSQEGEELARRGIFSSRSFHRIAIGGGAEGFEGALGGGLAGGVRIPFGRRHGPVLRAGIEGYLLGNDAFYSSLLELPQIQLGYQYMRGTTVFELGATTGVVLTGRWRGGDAETRRLGGFETGAYIAVQMPWVRLGATATRLPTDDGLQSAVAVAQATLCFRSVPVAICADARAMRGDAIITPGAGPSDVRAFYGGLVLGLTRER